MAVPILVGTPAASKFTSASSYTLAYTNDGGTNSGVFVITEQLSNGTPDSITYGGVTMTNILNLTGAQRARGYMSYLPAAVTGNQNVVVSWPGSQSGAVNAFTLTGVEQSTAAVVDVMGQADGGGGGTSLSKSVTTTVNDDLIVVWIINGPAGSAYSANSPQTVISTLDSPTGNPDDFNSSYQAKATAGAITSGYTWTPAADSDLYVVALKQSTAAPAAQPAIFMGCNF